MKYDRQPVDQKDIVLRCQAEHLILIFQLSYPRRVDSTPLLAAGGSRKRDISGDFRGTSPDQPLPD